jgi:predicted nucleic acid-binding protein
MPDALFDTCVLVKIFLDRNSAASHDLLRLATSGAYDLVVPVEIVDETVAVLRAMLSNEEGHGEDLIQAYRHGLEDLNILPCYTEQERLPRTYYQNLNSDDLIRDLAVALGPDYIVTFSGALLNLETLHTRLYDKPIKIVTPKTFLSVLKNAKETQHTNDSNT